MVKFTDPVIVTSIKFVVDPTGFAEKLKERMEAVKLRSQRFEFQALKLSMLMQAHSAQLHHLTSQQVQAIAARTKHMECQIVQSKMATFDMLEKLDTLTQGNTGSPLLRGGIPNPPPRLPLAHPRAA